MDCDSSRRKQWVKLPCYMIYGENGWKTSVKSNRVMQPYQLTWYLRKRNIEYVRIVTKKNIKKPPLVHQRYYKACYLHSLYVDSRQHPHKCTYHPIMEKVSLPSNSRIRNHHFTKKYVRSTTNSKKEKATTFKNNKLDKPPIQKKQFFTRNRNHL